MNNFKKLKRYIFWKLNIDKFILRITKNYWNKGKNYEWIYKFIEGKNLESRSIVEIGSRDALDSISMLKKFNFKKAFIFEPSIPGIKESLKNIEKSKFKNKINFYPFAIGCSTELRTFYENTEKIDVPNIGASSFSSSNLLEYKSYKVPIFKITDVLGDENSDFYLLMIDVEGFELEVISNQKNFFSKFKFICIEVAFSTDNYPKHTNLLHVDKILDDYGFKLYSSKHFGQITIDELLNNNQKYVDLLYKKAN